MEVGSKDLFEFCMKQEKYWNGIEKLVFENLPSSTNKHYLDVTVSKYSYQVQIARHITNNIVITHYVRKNKNKFTPKEIMALKAHGLSGNGIDTWTKEFSAVLPE